MSSRKVRTKTVIEYSTITGCISQSASVKNMRWRDKINLANELIDDLGITKAMSEDKVLFEKFNAVWIKQTTIFWNAKDGVL